MREIFECFFRNALIPSSLYRLELRENQDRKSIDNLVSANNEYVTNSGLKRGAAIDAKRKIRVNCAGRMLEIVNDNLLLR